jgi:nucleoid-associated protein YgaU
MDQDNDKQKKLPEEDRQARPKTSPQPSPKPATPDQYRSMGTGHPQRPQRPQSPAARPSAGMSSPPVQAPKTQPAYLAQHTVVSGETLSHIALKYYGSAAKEQWMRIYEANRDLIGDNPNKIRVGQVLNIPEK